MVRQFKLCILWGSGNCSVAKCICSWITNIIFFVSLVTKLRTFGILIDLFLWRIYCRSRRWMSYIIGAIILASFHVDQFLYQFTASFSLWCWCIAYTGFWDQRFRQVYFEVLTGDALPIQICQCFRSSGGINECSFAAIWWIYQCFHLLLELVDVIELFLWSLYLYG